MGLFQILVLLVGPAAAVVVVVLIFRSLRLLRHARQLGYASLTAYLRAAPQTDEEKRVAADLALKGLVICLLGLLFPPLLLIGLVPFFYGTRKVIYATMGLGLADDPGRHER